MNRPPAVETSSPPERRAHDEFVRRFGGEPSWLVRAPGRVNLLGEHTDYNDGFVLPLAIDRAAWLALRPRDDGRVEAWSADLEAGTSFALGEIRSGETGWAEYVKGVAWGLAEAGYRLHGWEGVIAGDVPIGAGLSSSAALELAVARAFACVSPMTWEPVAMARAAQHAENAWVGLACGIMDQLVAAAGREGHALLIDCRSLETTAVPVPARTVVVVLDTGTRRDLTSSAYNVRRSECEAAARAYRVPALRDLYLADLRTPPPDLDPVSFRRARHVVSENGRVQEAAEAMRHGDVARLGALMREGHASMRDDFEASSAALNAMVVAADRAGCYGSRMTGAGFAGCVVALVDAADSGTFVERAITDYRTQTGLTPTAFICRASAGATAVRLGAA